MTPAPKTTHRVDADIFAEARSALDRRPDVPATVRVHVDKGIATLTGNVRLPAERLAAEDAVRRVPAVQRLINDITVDQPVSPEGFEAPEEGD